MKTKNNLSSFKNHFCRYFWNIKTIAIKELIFSMPKITLKKCNLATTQQKWVKSHGRNKMALFCLFRNCLNFINLVYIYVFGNLYAKKMFLTLKVQHLNLYPLSLYNY